MGFMVPDTATTHFHVRAGDRVGDFGAGSGHFTRALSRVVGESGKVFAVEIQRQLAEAIGDMARKEHLHNVESIWGDLEVPGGTKLPDGLLDAVLISNTLSMLEQHTIAIHEAARVLRKGGVVIIIDWTDPSGGLGPAADMIVSNEKALALGEEAGLSHERDFPAGSHHYGIVLRKR